MNYLMLLLCFVLLFFSNYETKSQIIDWYGSAIYKESPFKPKKDSLGNKWYDFLFDDNNWISITKLPDKNWGCTDCDRYYRGYINLNTNDLNNFNYFVKFQRMMEYGYILMEIC